jgi:rubrerythrin
MKPKNGWEASGRAPVALFPGHARRRPGGVVDRIDHEDAPSFRRASCGASASVRSEHARVLVDELAARLAYERLGVRLYDALYARLARGEEVPGVVEAQLVAVRREEAEHAALARRSIVKLGGDPKALLIAHEVDARARLGVPERLEDARTNVIACLDALVRAELADQDGWTVLLALARLLGREELMRRFERALTREREHLRVVRHWACDARIRRAAGAE